MQNDYSTQVLHEVFTHYSSNEAQSTMDNIRFRRFAQDSPNLLDSHLTLVDVDLVFTKARGTSRRKLDFSQFLEALMLLANKKYPSEGIVTPVYCKIKLSFALFIENVVAFSRLMAESLFLLPCAPVHAQQRAQDFAYHHLHSSAPLPRPSKVKIPTIDPENTSEQLHSRVCELKYKKFVLRTALRTLETFQSCRRQEFFLRWKTECHKYQLTLRVAFRR